MRTVYALPSDFTIYAAALTRQEMLGVLATCVPGSEGAGLDVYGGSVQAIDAAGVQILLALDRQCRELGLDWRITRPSAALHKALRWLPQLPVDRLDEGAGVTGAEIAAVLDIERVLDEGSDDEGWLSLRPSADGAGSRAGS